jgi:putative spermidine/putrescine transport system ATP-binding protein
MARLELDRLSKRYGATTTVKDVSLTVADGEFLVLLGPSGCGKTTTLRMVAGFVEPSEGRIRLGGADITHRPAWRRNTGMVFQSYALFPHMTVADNVAFGLEMRKVPRAEREARALEALRLVRLDGLADRLPRQLSGGQQQRVALARALARRPRLILADEPTGNLDRASADEVFALLRRFNREHGSACLIVTHDASLASRCDRRIELVDGHLLAPPSLAQA